uniref:Galactose oxidase n=1 Tax=Kalanchoe fedtschenkoi TaxID=63787 RepID=A0A7N0TIU8_KALFE
MAPPSSMVDFLKALCLVPLLFGYGHSIAAPFDLFKPFGSDNNNNSPSDNFKTSYDGKWELLTKNAAVVGMHIQLMPNSRVILYDATQEGDSMINLTPGTPCRIVYPRQGDPPGTKPRRDCLAHAIDYDPDDGSMRPLKLESNGWCSSGGLTADGTFTSTGGWYEGERAVRYIQGCPTCDWSEYPTGLASPRWYSTQAILPDGRIIILGGRRAWSYEYLPPKGRDNLPAQLHNFPFFWETTDPRDENNLYPFAYVSTDGNLFVFANNRSLLLNPVTNRVVREFPVLPGGSRCYPASAMSALLPINVESPSQVNIPAEVIVCGGAPQRAYRMAEDQKVFLTALDDCNRLVITDPFAEWKKEKMPTPRVMSDMLILPTAELLMINGARKGTSAWQFADDPVYTPFVYDPEKAEGKRFKILKASNIPRMYHSTSVLLPDGKILVTGSSTNPRYMFKNVKFPTELRLEKFAPHYLDPKLAKHRPEILQFGATKELEYQQKFTVQFEVEESEVEGSGVKVTMLRPPFTTHGYSMDQRMVVLPLVRLRKLRGGTYRAEVYAPPSGAVAPPGYYLVFVVNGGVPSKGVWVHIH